MKRPQTIWLAAGLVALVTLVTYGVQIAHLGFYRDDWQLLSVWQSQGAKGVWVLEARDRPFRGYVYILWLQLIGLSPLAWQLAALFMRLVGNLSFLWLARLVWPQRNRETLAIALLYSVYPGYVQQPNAALFIVDLMTNAAALLSFILAILALRSRRLVVKVGLALVAGLLELAYFGLFESSIGLEAARFAILLYLIWKETRLPALRLVWRTLKADVLYILLLGGFLIWRIFIFNNTRRATDVGQLASKYTGSPLHALPGVAIETFKDFLETAFFAWVVPFYQFVSRGNYRDLLTGVAIAAVLLVCVFIAVRQPKAAAEARTDEKMLEDARPMICLGAWIVACALLPINLAGRDVLFTSQWDRYTIYASIGVAILIGGMMFRYLEGGAQTGLLLFLLGLSIVTHYFSASSYREFWVRERDLWQQLTWRAPGLQRGTMVFAILPSSSFEQSYEIYGPVNMIYYPGQGMQLGGAVVNSETAAQLQMQKNRSHSDPSILVEDNYRNALVMAYPSSGSCLHVLDGRKIEMPGLLDGSLLADVAIYSRIDQIETDSQPVKLPSYLQGETPRAWCYYYQKMDLSRQLGDWKQVAALADEATKKGLKPEDPSELMPALEAYATLGRVQDAKHDASIIRADDATRTFLCLQLQRGAAYPPPYPYTLVNQILCQANGE